MTHIGDPNFWRGFLAAVRTEPREVSVLKGISGLDHPVLALGVDDKRGRIVAISSDHDARAAAMMQSDVQATFRDNTKVIVARPVAINLPNLAQKLIEKVGSTDLALGELAKLNLSEEDPAKEFLKFAEPWLEQTTLAFKIAPLNIISQVVQIIQQLSLISFNTATVLQTEAETGESDAGQEITGFGLAPLAATNPTELDQKLGVCAVPLFEFTEGDFDLLVKDCTPDDAAEILRGRGILQYFFPPTDQTALGLIDRGLKDHSKSVEWISRASELGHPPSSGELIPPETKLVDIVDCLQDMGLLVEGEFGLEISDDGKVQRALVRFKPREGLLSKLINQVSINVNLRDFFGPPNA